jgi:hypothetical protein
MTTGNTYKNQEDYYINNNNNHLIEHQSFEEEADGEDFENEPIEERD